MYKPIFILLALILPASLMADVQLRLSDGNGRSSTFSSNGYMVRVDDPALPGYVLIDSARGDFFMVDAKRNRVMRSSVKTGRPNGAAIGITLKDKGGGQKIAGYLTRKYEFKADGQACGTIYASNRLLQQSGVRAMFDSMRELQQQARRFTEGLGNRVELCRRANLQLADALQAKGAPLRILGAEGQLVSEVTAVDTDKKFAAGHYQVPAGLVMVDLDAQMNQATEQTQQMLQNMPAMDELMEQLQDNGGQADPDVQQQLKKLQEMLQQQQ